jgi:hypothetical protein
MGLSSVEPAFCRIPPGKYSGSFVIPCRLLTLCTKNGGSAPKGKGRPVGTGTGCKKLQSPHPVFIPPLGESAVSGVVAKRGKVLSGEPTAVEDHQRVHMPVWRVVIVNRGYKLDGLAIALFKLQHRGNGQSSQVKVFVAILPPRIGAEDHAVVIPAFFGRLVNHAVGILFGEHAVKAEEVAGDLIAPSISAVGNVADIGLGACANISVAFAIVGFDNQTGLPPLLL